MCVPSSKLNTFQNLQSSILTYIMLLFIRDLVSRITPVWYAKVYPYWVNKPVWYWVADRRQSQSWRPSCSLLIPAKGRGPQEGSMDASCKMTQTIAGEGVCVCTCAWCHWWSDTHMTQHNGQEHKHTAFTPLHLHTHHIRRGPPQLSRAKCTTSASLWPDLNRRACQFGCHHYIVCEGKTWWAIGRGRLRGGVGRQE